MRRLLIFFPIIFIFLFLFIFTSSVVNAQSCPEDGSTWGQSPGDVCGGTASCSFCNVGETCDIESGSGTKYPAANYYSGGGCGGCWQQVCQWNSSYTRAICTQGASSRSSPYYWQGGGSYSSGGSTCFGGLNAQNCDDADNGPAQYWSLCGFVPNQPTSPPATNTPSPTPACDPNFCTGLPFLCGSVNAGGCVYNCSCSGAYSGWACDTGTNQCVEPPTPTPTCTPQCSGKICGSDSCGGSCGSCGVGQTCSANQTACLAPTPTTTIIPTNTPTNTPVPPTNTPIPTNTPTKTPTPTITPTPFGACGCAGKACGQDGCGNSCGSCGIGDYCSGGACYAGSSSCSAGEHEVAAYYDSGQGEYWCDGGASPFSCVIGQCCCSPDAIPTDSGGGGGGGGGPVDTPTPTIACTSNYCAQSGYSCDAQYDMPIFSDDFCPAGRPACLCQNICTDQCVLRTDSCPNGSVAQAFGSCPSHAGNNLYKNCLCPTSTPLPSATPLPWIKLKDGSFQSTSSLNNPIPNTVQSFDSSDQPTPYFIIGPQAGSVSAPSLSTSSTVSQNNWKSLYEPNISFRKDRMVSYIKSRKNHKDITSLAQITEDTDNTGVYQWQGALPLDLNSSNLPDKSFVLLVDNQGSTEGAVQITSDIIPDTNNSMAIIAENIEVTDTVDTIESILIADTVTLEAATRGLKIVGNLSTPTLTNNRSYTDAATGNKKPSLYIVNDVRTFMNLLPYISIARYEWRQTQ